MTCPTSPHCSHNTNGRDLAKPCSIEFPTQERDWERSWKEIEPETIDHLATVIMCMLDEDTGELRDKHYEEVKDYIENWVKYRSLFLRQTIQAEREKAKEITAKSTDLVVAFVRQAERSRIVGILEELLPEETYSKSDYQWLKASLITRIKE